MHMYINTYAMVWKAEIIYYFLLVLLLFQKNGKKRKYTGNMIKKYTCAIK